MSDAAFALVFYACAALSVIPAVAILLTAEIVRQAFWLLATLCGVAGLYLLLGADFLGLTQILVYIGGIMILMLFGVMLTQRGRGTYGHAETTRAWPAGLAAVGLMLLMGLQLVSAAMGSGQVGDTVAPAAPTTRAIGHALMSSYIFPFEIVSLVLLAALVGAAFLARRTQPGAPPDTPPEAGGTA